MLAYRNGKLCLVYIDDNGEKKSSPIHIPWINKGCGSTSKEEYLKRLKEQLYKYVDESSNHRYRKITGITIDPPLPLDDYPNISGIWHVRELFVRIYDKLGFIILRSEENFPEFVLLFDNLPYVTTLAVKASSYTENKVNEKNCD